MLSTLVEQSNYTAAAVALREAVGRGELTEDSSVVQAVRLQVVLRSQGFLPAVNYLQDIQQQAAVGKLSAAGGAGKSGAITCCRPARYHCMQLVPSYSACFALPATLLTPVAQPLPRRRPTLLAWQLASATASEPLVLPGKLRAELLAAAVLEDGPASSPAVLTPRDASRVRRHGQTPAAAVTAWRDRLPTPEQLASPQHIVAVLDSVAASEGRVSLSHTSYLEVLEDSDLEEEGEVAEKVAFLFANPTTRPNSLGCLGVVSACAKHQPPCWEAALVVMHSMQQYQIPIRLETQCAAMTACLKGDRLTRGQSAGCHQAMQCAEREQQ